jgi:NAD(P)H dehydrogenase (quinone)
VPEPPAGILADVDVAVGPGLLEATPGGPSRLIGRPTTPIADSVAQDLTG